MSFKLAHNLFIPATKLSQANQNGWLGVIGGNIKYLNLFRYSGHQKDF